MHFCVHIVLQLSALREEQRAEVDSLLAKFARDNAQSDAVRLQSQLKAKEVRAVNLFYGAQK